MKKLFPAMAKRSLALALALALLLSLCPVIPITAHAAETEFSTGWVTGASDKVSGSLFSEDEDLVFVDDQAYDWQFKVLNKLADAN